MDPAARIASGLRTVVCARCGGAFACGLGGDCWCVAEAFRVPMPATEAADCLCPTCLRDAASHQAQTLKR
jgi:hypothetical protein